MASRYRSKFEEAVARDGAAKAGAPLAYETLSISYVIEASYSPDFRLPSGIIVEAKGLFDADDRRKHLAIKRQHPGLDIRFVFQRAKSPIRKGSKTTYAAWCDRHGFKWAEGSIPMSWIRENRL